MNSVKMVIVEFIRSRRRKPQIYSKKKHHTYQIAPESQRFPSMVDWQCVQIPVGLIKIIA